MIVANACDPLVVWASATAATVVWVETDTLWTADAALCPACGSVLVRLRSEGRDRWDCPGCPLTQPAADYQVVDDSIRLPDGRTVTPRLQVIAQVNNLFDQEYATGAQLGPAGLTETGTFIARPLPAINGEFPVRHTTFLAVGAPRRAWIGARLRF